MMTDMSARPWKTLLAVDSDARACATYCANFPDVEVRCESVADVLDDLPAADLIIGGPPCQGFSVAGSGAGVDDERNAWPEMIAAIDRVRPRMFLAENVPGMLTERHMPYTQSVLSDLEALSYRVELRTLDAVSYGAPQFRRRVWWWGIREDVPARHVWPEPTHIWPPAPLSGLLPGVTVGEALGLDVQTLVQDARGLKKKQNGGGERSDTPAYTVDGLGTQGVHEYRWSDAMLAKHPPAAQGEPCPTVQAKWFKGGAEGLVVDPRHPRNTPDAPGVTQRSGGDGHSAPGHCTELEVVGIRRKRGASVSRPDHGTEQPSPSVTVPGGSASGLFTIHRRRGAGLIERSGERDDTTSGEPMPTVNAGVGRQIHLVNGPLVRRLSPLECARLQSCPDDMAWPERITKTAMYRIVGNGWNCAQAAALSRALRAADPASVTIIDLFCGGGLGALGWHGRYWSRPGDEI